MSVAHYLPWPAYEQWARERWASTRDADPADMLYRDLAETTGYARSRIAKAKREQRISILAARDLARGLGHDPVAALGEWTPLELLHAQAPPTDREWITQLQPADLHLELAHRLGGPRHPLTTPADWTSASAWGAALLDGPVGLAAGVRRGRRAEVAGLLGCPYGTVRTKARRGSWSVPELVAVCGWSGWSLRLGLGVMGWFSWGELGLDVSVRGDALGRVEVALLWGDAVGVSPGLLGVEGVSDDR